MDIDIDFQSTFNVKSCFEKVTVASLVTNAKLTKHNSGVYFQKIPKDSHTGLAAIPYKEAERLGFFKVDFLHINLLDVFESKEEIRRLIKIEPDWNLLNDEENVKKLTQIHRHFDIVYKIKPRSIEDLSDVIALIRPAKRTLLNEYIKNKKAIRTILYQKPDDPTKYYFKRAHAIAYAHNIVLQMHLL